MSADGLHQRNHCGLLRDHGLDLGLLCAERRVPCNDHFGIIDDSGQILIVGDGFRAGRRSRCSGLVNRDTGKNASRSEIVLDLLKGGKDGLAIGGDGLVILGTRLKHLSVPGAEVEQGHHSTQAQ